MELGKVRYRDGEFQRPPRVVDRVNLHLPVIGRDRLSVERLPLNADADPPFRHRDNLIRR